MSKMSNLTNQRFGKLTVLRLANDSEKKQIRDVSHTQWLCGCFCGNTVVALSNKLLMQRTTSCGCLGSNPSGGTTHGMSHSAEYSAWSSMKARCHNKNNKKYKNYGARGIKVCNRWLESFENFFADMKERPIGYSLERLNVNEDYTPENCIWLPFEQQNWNRQHHVRLTYNGITLNLSQWAKKFNIRKGTLSRWIKGGSNLEQIINRLSKAKQESDLCIAK